MRRKLILIHHIIISISHHIIIPSYCPIILSSSHHIFVHHIILLSCKHFIIFVFSCHHVVMPSYCCCIISLYDHNISVVMYEEEGKGMAIHPGGCNCITQPLSHLFPTDAFKSIAIVSPGHYRICFPLVLLNVL